MSKLNIRLLGAFNVTVGAEGEVRIPTRKAELLLAFLATRMGQGIPRASVEATLWPRLAPDRARRALSSELWRLRRALNATGIDAQRLITATRTTICLVSDGSAHTDLSELQDQIASVGATIRKTISDSCRCSVRKLTQYVRRPFMEGLHDEWIILERGAIRAQLANILSAVVEAAIRCQDWDFAIEIGTPLVDEDPTQETIHRALMIAYSMRGDRASALFQYEKCATALRRELGVLPGPETTRVHRTLLRQTAEGVELPDQKEISELLENSVQHTHPAIQAQLSATLDAMTKAHSALSALIGLLRRPDTH